MNQAVTPLHRKNPIEEHGRQMMAESKFYMGYSRWDDQLGRYENWEDAISRVEQMHRDKYADRMSPELDRYIFEAHNAYRQSRVLGAQRALQFGGEQIFKHEARLYNCASSAVDRPEFFQQAMYLLLCGCGVGFSVQKHHIDKLPSIYPRQEKSKVFVIPDSIEGWADAFSVLLSSYLDHSAPFPEYQGCHVAFDYSEIRPEGAYISGGFKAPGPEGLRRALNRCETLLDTAVKETNRIKPIVAYDFVMHMADAVLSGGIRRAATICLFSKDDQEMLDAKTGDWFVKNPQRGRSNNSVMLLRDDLKRDEWAHIMKSVRQVGEPGFVMTDSLEFTYNPCVEIGMLPYTEDGRSGFQMCNLTEINGSMCNDKASFLEACWAASVIGTLQAGYAHFPYLGEATDEIVQREALLGVSITGWMNNPDILFDPEIMREGAELVKETNKKVAKLLGINPAARTTCVKPSGNASVLLGTASGIHAEHAPRYFRNVQMNANDGVLELIKERNPCLVETSVWNPNGTDKVVSFPIVSPEGSIYKADIPGIKQLEYVKLAQQNWVEYGTNLEACRDKRLRHNVSNTIPVDDWDEVEEYIYQNREWFAGISLLSAMGDKAYPQAPFTEVFTMEEITERYGDASLFASGLIVDGLHAFDNNLWLACDTVMGHGLELDPEDSADLLKRDWIRRAINFATNYFNGDILEMTNCLKDCHNFHKWKTIERKIKPISFADAMEKQSYTDINTMGAQACAGGACEI